MLYSSASKQGDDTMRSDLPDTSDLPLSGIRVVDFSTLLPGPLATLLLRRAGAEVIKIEPPAGDAMRTLLNDDGAAFGLLNRGKRSVSADLKSAADRDLVRHLCKDADVVVEQFRPGVMDRLGLGYVTLRDDNPSVVYCSITGYGQRGAERDLAGHDINYLASSGMFSVFCDPDGAPVMPPVLLADVVGGAYPAFQNIVLALFRRLRTGVGAHLDISMTRGLQALSVSSVARAQGTAATAGSALDGSEANYRCYRCADGGWLAVGALEMKFWLRFCELIQLEAELSTKSPGMPEVVEAVAARLAEQPVAWWLERFAGEDVCCSSIRSLPDVLALIAQEHAGSAGHSLPLPLAPGFDRLDDADAPHAGEANTEYGWAGSHDAPVGR
jgi:alpha-methylacyl-CoA racemase